ncbi:hypothetical protein GCM10023149_37760 [Mucilaginibacter gynuensis]|uniref:TraG P-loop domain-containing protein n=1 Tax=Mucilaginibacter gynuensis TaxID=1302236 RepID=A0ABP8GYI0_9SPHI
MAVKSSFNLPYAGVDKTGEHHLLLGLCGEYSIVIQMVNPVIRYSANPAEYGEFHSLLLNIIKLLGEGFLLQKTDIISHFEWESLPVAGYLQQQYNEHFKGRQSLKIDTYLIITWQPKKGIFYTYDPRNLSDFQQKVNKVIDLLPESRVLKEDRINHLIVQLLGMDFRQTHLSLNNLLPSSTGIGIGNREIRSITLVNIDSIDLPAEMSTHIELRESEATMGFPVDIMSFLFSVPDCDAIVVNQVIEIPDQNLTLRKLEQKKKRHSGIPDPANQLCVEDIELLLNNVARENQLLVNCHFNIVLAAPEGALHKAANFVESALFQQGIIPSRNAYNQLELFRSVLPGNGVELKAYDWFLTTAEAAACFFFKEALPKDEPSDFLIRFTDRQGIPIAIDPADLPMRNGRINNRNKFVLGPSGSGKSFFMNTLIEQYLQYDMDVVIIDVGHSYSGLSSFYNGKYITYTDENPITMNPFAINEEEYNIEKKDFLVTLIGLLWKGTEAQLSAIEQDVISEALDWYYAEVFNHSSDAPDKCCFDTFYAFAIAHIPLIKEKAQIPFDLHEFRYVLKKFSYGGQYQSILNEAADASLFNERFIVYEIDNVQNNRVLFPIVTLIIMDVFIQKMRHRKNRRKAIVLEEAWKALTSPVMAGFLLYLNKTVRKFYGEIIEVTQELSDIIGNPMVKDSIISNSDTVILLDQTKFRDNYNEIASLLSISDTERRKIFTINQLDNSDGRGRFKEVYIRRGSVGEVYGVEVSLHQYLCYTTEKPEKTAVEKYALKYGSYPAGLDAFVGDLKHSQLSLTRFIEQVNQNVIL